jgi:bifunctional non-homologous end joining protein LigD
MGLETYQTKRKFDETPEPSGLISKGDKAGLRFVIQKHAASHLHYDFRLEFDGVLKSWAIPKGPSLDSSVKRLAMAVEDHPLDYRTFEGNIPAGNYGAGTVMIWDEGTYTVADGLSQVETERRMAMGLASGKLTFQLQGHKLQGEFALIRTHRDPKSWLLIKHQDEFVNAEDILLMDCSAVSDRTMAEIQAASKPARSKRKPHASHLHNPEHQKNKSKRALKNPVISAAKLNQSPDPFPSPVQPMLATLVDRPFDKKDWLFEIKWDGYRAIAEIRNDNFKLYSRNLLPFETKYPHIMEDLKALQGIKLFWMGKLWPWIKLENPVSNIFKITRSVRVIWFIMSLIYSTWTGRIFAIFP